MNLSEAKEKTVFEIQGDKVIERNLYEKMYDSIDETTTPRGVAPRMFVEELEFVVDPNDFDDEDDLESEFRSIETRYRRTNKSDFKELPNGTFVLNYFTISNWGCTGNKYKNGSSDWTMTFLTQEEVDEEMFEFLKRDYNADWDNSCNCYDTKDEAIEVIAERNELSFEVMKSIIKKQELIDSIREERNKIKREKNREQINELAKIYSKNIEKISGENYKETCKRLSDSLNIKLPSTAFHMAVKMIRNSPL